ncbi:MAG: 6-phosphogluconolactonase [Acidimicrobiia bacterium]|nr:6-phosphogluconolactonase [Acidimicrobiia bacterium]
MSPELTIHKPDEWGAAGGALLVERLQSQPGLSLCLPTGNTPVPAYAAFASGGGTLDSNHLFLLDDFLLPDGHPARCDLMLSRTLLDRLAAPPRSLHRLDVAAPDLDAECARFESLVDEHPLDLTLLGLGGNGHLGLNEPGSNADSRTRVVKLEPDTIRSAAVYGDGIAPRHGVTLGMRSILRSQEIWLLVTGGHKAGILERTLRGPVGSAVPASFLQFHPNTVVLADTAAVAGFG